MPPTPLTCAQCLALASFAGEILSNSMLRVTTTIVLAIATLAIVVHICSPTRMMAILDNRLWVVEQAYIDAIGVDLLSLISPTPLDNELARRLITLQDGVLSLRTQTLQYSTMSIGRRLWDEICGLCRGHSLAIWQRSRELSALHTAIQVRNEATRETFNTEMAGFNSPVIQLALRHRYAKARPM
ncbi:hypothetical protein B0H19DRAFT_1072185 [Mycena capillaripes]|nr:hypothetical protein B0H19DRAFT_1072185 [Mycena capillaripes]